MQSEPAISPAEPPSGIELPRYRFAAYAFLRGLGLVYLCAFVSLWVQVDGLIGARGILPIAPLVEQLHGQVGWWKFPTLSWWFPGDAALNVQCGAGVALSALLMAGVAPALCAPLLWALYLSLCIAGQQFLSFQWDALLLEAGLIAIWLAPWKWFSRPGRDPAPPRAALLLLQFLLFKLMFLSGYVKLASRDPSWRDLTALTYHYWTTCLPTWTGWYADKLPLWFQKFSCGAMFFIEFALPFLIWGPGRALRWIAFGGIVGLQALIASTGNYTFFNLLTIVLCLPILDDRCWRFQAPELPPRRAQKWLATAAAVPLALVSALIFTNTIRWPIPWPRAVMQLHRALAPFRSVNGYGLFASMTKKRMEIIVEGSDDGETWKAYEFKWKPGDPKRRPRFVEPHQPRLDWQMWFAALSAYEREPWFTSFLAGLLEGSPPVLDLMGSNPFPDHPPKFIRAAAWDYRFTSRAQRREDGSWWTRRPLGLYCPAVSLRSSQSLEP